MRIVVQNLYSVEVLIDNVMAFNNYTKMTKGTEVSVENKTQLFSSDYANIPYKPQWAHNINITRNM